MLDDTKKILLSKSGQDSTLDEESSVNERASYSSPQVDDESHESINYQQLYQQVTKIVEKVQPL